MIAALATPSIDWGALSPYLALLAGVALVMLVSVFVPGSARNALGAAIAVLSLVGAGAAAVILYTSDATGENIIAGSLRSDRLADLGSSGSRSPCTSYAPSRSTGRSPSKRL